MSDGVMSALTTKLPLWQVLLFGSTTFIAGRFLARYGARALHTTAAAQKKPKQKQVEPAFGEDTKLVLIVRTDLGMTKGKVAAQCAHAALGCYKRALKQNPAVLKAWEYTGQAKVTLKVNSEEEMLELQRKAA
ncbi:hypothetical protein EC988_010352, partial [Linderina pennispora]